MYVYILYSPQLDRYYIGETKDLAARIALHNTGHFTKSYTSKASDWKLTLSMSCKDRVQARNVEAHIKRMKSRKISREPDPLFRNATKVISSIQCLWFVPIAIGTWRHHIKT